MASENLKSTTNLVSMKAALMAGASFTILGVFMILLQSVDHLTIPIIPIFYSTKLTVILLYLTSSDTVSEFSKQRISRKLIYFNDNVKAFKTFCLKLRKPQVSPQN